MKTNRNLINVTLAIATILILTGLILRLLEINFGYVIGIIGLTTGLITLVFRSTQSKKNTSFKKFKWINIVFAIATAFVVLGFSLRLMEFGNGTAFKFIGLILGLTAFTFSIYNQKMKSKSVRE